MNQLQDQHRNELAGLKEANSRAVARIEDQHREAFTALQDKHLKEIQELNEEFEKRIDGLRRDQRQKMASAFTEFQSIFDGNKKTINYIDALEGKVKAGQAVSRAEVEKLAVIATGLGYLQKQYQKPMEEFKELEKFLARQTSGINQQRPASSFGFFKRMFDKGYRDAEHDYYRNEGARQAFTSAQSKFSTVYGAAQRQMASVSINADAYTKKLYALLDEKQQANTEDLSKFFDQARQALKTHQEVLDFQPERLPESPTKLQP
ncbi:MAG: hypothetical protein JWO08_3812 [Verrucomicrobiaceae bacterium]|nr:hypothetical protein [Verrucomicrobiaceae bacterium]